MTASPVADQPVLRLQVPATLVGARAATEQLMALVDGFNTEDRALFETAVMEWLVNIVKHSYASTADGGIELTVHGSRTALHLVIEDHGRGLSAAQFKAAPASIDFDPGALEDLPESGMGLAILKSVMDSVRYEQHPGANRLMAIKRWSVPP